MSEFDSTDINKQKLIAAYNENKQFSVTMSKISRWIVIRFITSLNSASNLSLMLNAFFGLILLFSRKAKTLVMVYSKLAVIDGFNVEVLKKGDKLVFREKVLSDSCGK
jgi:hypothetical protein